MHCRQALFISYSIFSSGTEYEGNYINDKRHGHGIFKMVDGSVFEVSDCQVVTVSSKKADKNHKNIAKN